MDSVKVGKFEFPDENLQDQVPLKYGIDLGITGLYINKTFGIHPILAASIDKYNRKNTYKLLYQVQYGHSKNKYLILDNDSLKSTNVFNGQFIGAEYERMLLWRPNQELFGNFGIGYDWIRIPKEDGIHNIHFLGGWGLNMGIRYCPYIKKKHGPNLCLLYHFTDFKNKGGSDLNNNSIVIRVSYNFGRLSMKW
jgi:hypothetical protein